VILAYTILNTDQEHAGRMDRHLDDG